MEVIYSLAPLFFISLAALLLLAIFSILAVVYVRVAPQGGSSAAQMRSSRLRQQEYRRRLLCSEGRGSGSHGTRQDHDAKDDSAFDALPQAEPAPAPVLAPLYYSGKGTWVPKTALAASHENRECAGTASGSTAQDLWQDGGDSHGARSVSRAG